MTASGPLLTLEDLSVSFGGTAAVRGVDLAVRAGESVAILGESGSGKSVTGRAILGLIDPPGRVGGSIRFEGRELVGQSDAQLADVRGRKIAMVFQDALDSLNPVFSVGDQIAEILRVRLGWNRARARAETVALMRQVGISEPERRLGAYPHQFSGGMRQRICIAMAIALKPQLLIADEPTTALDVTVQAGILALINRLRVETGMALIFVTHDLAVARLVARELVVMYAGQAVERGNLRDIFKRPSHPYTRALLGSNPAAVTSWRDLTPIRGNPPDKTTRFTGCAFAARCPHASARCHTEAPELAAVALARLSRCHFAAQVLDAA